MKENFKSIDKRNKEEHEEYELRKYIKKNGIKNKKTKAFIKLIK